MVPVPERTGEEKPPELKICDLLEELERLLSEGRVLGSEMALIHIRRAKELVGCARPGERSVVVVE